MKNIGCQLAKTNYFIEILNCIIFVCFLMLFFLTKETAKALGLETVAAA